MKPTPCKRMVHLFASNVKKTVDVFSVIYGLLLIAGILTGEDLTTCMTIGILIAAWFIWRTKKWI